MTKWEDMTQDEKDAARERYSIQLNNAWIAANRAIIMSDNTPTDAVMDLMIAVIIIAERARLPNVKDEEIIQALHKNVDHIKNLLPTIKSFVAWSEGQAAMGETRQ
jgi:hypothetical protein